MKKSELQKVNRKKNKIVVSNAIYVDEKVWFMSRDFNGLLCMDAVSRQIERVETFPNEMYGQFFLYSAMEMVDDKIYFAPYYAKEIAIYDIKGKMFKKIEIDESILQRESGKNLFYGIQKYEDYLFFIPAYSKAIVRLNTSNEEICYITEWNDKISYNYDKNSTFFWTQKVLRKNILYLPFYNINAVLKLNCDSLACEVHKLNIDETGFSGICDDGRDIWLYTRKNGDLIKWNPKSDETIRYNIYSEKIIDGWDSLARIISCNNKIAVYSVRKSLRRLNKVFDSIEINVGEYTFVKDEEQYTAFYEECEGMLTIFDKKEAKWHVVEISSDESIFDATKMICESGMVMEINEYLLDDFVADLVLPEKKYIN